MIFLWIDPIKAREKYSMKYFLYHPISNYCKEYDNLEDFSKNFKLEKEELEKTYNFDYKGQKIKEFRMSEFLILEKTIFLDKDWCIIVYSDESLKKVKEIIEKQKNQYGNINIYIRPNFF